MSTFAVPRYTLTVDGVEYECEHAKVERFSLGLEDHGLFTAFVTFAGAGWGQGVSLHALDSYDEASKRRVGTAFGCDYIMECVRVLGSPENAVGRQVVLFRKRAMIEGFAALRPDGSIGEPFFPATLTTRHFPSAGGAA